MTAVVRSSLALCLQWYNAIDSSSVKTVTNSHQLDLYHSKRLWRAFLGY